MLLALLITMIEARYIMIKAVLLDFYGTLVEADGLYIKKQICKDIYVNSIKEFSIDKIESYWYKLFENLVTTSYGSNFKLQREIELTSLKDTIAYCNSTASVKELSEILFSYWSSPKSFENTKIMLSKLTLPTCIISNIDNSNLNNALNKLQYTPDFIVTSESEKAYKPRPEMFERALRLLHLKPNEVIMVGDSLLSDVVGSSNFGIPNIWINYLKIQNSSEIQPNYEISDIKDLLPLIGSL